MTILLPLFVFFSLTWLPLCFTNTNPIFVSTFITSCPENETNPDWIDQKAKVKGATKEKLMEIADEVRKIQSRLHTVTETASLDITQLKELNRMMLKEVKSFQ